LNKSVKTSELFECTVPYLEDFFSSFEYPWQMLPQIKGLISKIIEKGIDGYTLISDDILVGKFVKIDKAATIIGPAIIGDNTEIRPCAYIRGNFICGRNCVLGNSSEFKNCILLDNVQAPHYNYIGDSILGFHAHMGAGSICSNLKSDGKNVIIHGETEIETGLRKIGAFLGDNAEIGCGCVLNPGTVIGKNTSVYPLTSVRGVVPMNSIVKSQAEIVDKI